MSAAYTDADRTVAGELARAYGRGKPSRHDLTTAREARRLLDAFPLVAAQVEADEVPATIHGKPVRVDRVWRQVRDGLDRDRLLPADDKRRRDLAKRLDKPLDRNGWRMFAAGCAWTVEHGKATQRRNAEIQLVEAVARWTADVAELLPERMAELRIIVDHGLSHPAPPPRKDGDK